MRRFNHRNGELAERIAAAVFSNDDLIIGHAGATSDLCCRRGAKNRCAATVCDSANVHGVIVMRVHRNDRSESAYAVLVEDVVDGRRIAVDRPPEQGISK